LYILIQDCVYSIWVCRVLNSAA